MVGTRPNDFRQSTHTDIFSGTWLNSDSNSLKSALAIPSNVTRLSRAIKPVSSDGVPQVTYYHFGVGAGNGVFDKWMGATGAGLAEIVREGCKSRIHRIYLDARGYC